MRRIRALDLARASIRYSPLVASWIPAVLSTSLYLTGQPREAADVARHAITLALRSLDAHLMLAAAAAASGDGDQATRAAEGMRQLDPRFSLKRFAEVQPHQDPQVLESVVEDLRKAGLS